MQLEDTWAVIMAGGSGTRFWPASRPDRPKQFLTIAGEEPMLRATALRLEGLVPIDRILVVAGAAHAELVREVLPELPAENLLLEPIGRNTLACVALAHFEIERRSPSAVQIHLPADHVIQPQESLRASLSKAAGVARAHPELVIFGIQPTHAATGYGYLELGPALDEASTAEARRVRRFVEKPERARAQEFLDSGNFLWNSGMFVWGTATLRTALFEHAPQLAQTLEQARPTELDDVYPDLPSLPIDVGILEKAGNVCALPIDYSWNDVGSWSALAEVLPSDSQGHFVSGGVQTQSLGSAGCVVHGPRGERIALVGVQDLIVVRSGNTTLICPRERAQDVKRLVEGLDPEPA